MTKSFIQVGVNTVDAATVTKPLNRDFRDAWQLSGEIIEVDMVKARDIHRDKIRAARAAEFVTNDVAIQDAILADDAAGKAAGIARRDALRNATADAAIEAAATPEVLSAVAPAGLTL